MPPLMQFREFLERAYVQRLGVPSLTPEISDVAPSWSFVDERDYLKIVNKESLVAAIADPEIGLLLFAVDYDGGNLHGEFTRALAASSRLLVAKANESRDRKGPWAVGLLWLVKKSFEQQWREAIAERRGRSGVTEELLVDAIFYAPNKLLDALQAQGVPCLLLQTRALLRMDPARVAKWGSANDEVVSGLKDLPDAVKPGMERDLAQRVLDRALERMQLITPKPVEKSSSNLESIALQNFRNVQSLELDLRVGGGDLVWPNVLFGPNGSGKSSITEAISIAISGQSKGMIDFAGDADQDKKVSYVTDVLRSLGAERGPEISLNGQRVGSIAQGESPVELRRLDGTILPQEKAITFVRATAAELASEALRDYSDVADDLLDFIERESKIANERKERFLRGLGERANISRIETILNRVAKNALASEFPREPQALVRWLNSFARINHEKTDEAIRLVERARLFSEEARSTLADQLAPLMEPHIGEAIEAIVTKRLSEWDRLCADAAQLSASLLGAGWEEWINQVVIDLQSWAKAQQARTHTFSEVAATPVAIKQAIARRDGLQKELADITRAGRETSAKLAHLESVAPFLGEWVKEHESQCPTCGHDHDVPLLDVIKEIKAREEARRLSLRAEYESVKRDVEAIQGLLAQAGAASAVLSEERQSELRELVRRATGERPLEELLKNADSAQGLIRLFVDIRSAPTLPAPTGSAAQAGAMVSRRIEALTIEAKQSLELPNAWTSVQSIVRARCEQVLLAKLPSTLKAVWLELVGALTPARWILSAYPSLEFETHRRAKKLMVAVAHGSKRILARYFYNLSECNVLGLSWFFLRYFTSGRFNHSFLVLDDPAQEMDQTTFAGLARFLGRLIRMHRSCGKRLTLLVLLNQEERALELARTCAALVHTLPWVRVQGTVAQGNPRRLMLLQEGVGTPTITEVFGRATLEAGGAS
jgi:hypothetical protein